MLTPEDLDRLEALAAQEDKATQHDGLHVLPAGSLRVDTDTVRELVRGYREADDLRARLRDALSVIAEEYNHCHGCDRHYDYDLKRIVHLPACLLHERPLPSPPRKLG